MTVKVLFLIHLNMLSLFLTNPIFITDYLVISGNRLPHEASWYIHGCFSSTYPSHGCGKRWALRATVVQNSKNYVLYSEYTFHVKYKSIQIGEGITFYLI